MSRLLIPIIALAIATPARGQEIERYVERNKQVQPVTQDKRLPVAGGPNGDAASALVSVMAYGQSSGVAVTGPLVFYSVAITLSSGQGPGRLMLWDSNAVPPDGPLTGSNRPMRCIHIDAGDRTAILASTSGLGITSSIAWAFSTAPDCLTLTRAATDFISMSFKKVTP